MASHAVVRHFLFAFDQPTSTAEILVAFTAVTNRMNIISVAVITIRAVICTAIFARSRKIVLGTIITPDFFLAAIVATFLFGDTVQASNLPTMST